jgi:hypothetical protein
MCNSDGLLELYDSVTRAISQGRADTDVIWRARVQNGISSSPKSDGVG